MSMLGFFFGDSYRHRAQRDQWRPTTVGKNLISPVNSYGTCFSCDGAGTRTFDCRCCDGSGHKTLDCRCCSGTGSVTLDCRLCAGSGKVTLPAQPCFTCHGPGRQAHGQCRRCRGTGCHKPECSVTCRQVHRQGFLFRFLPQVRWQRFIFCYLPQMQWPRQRSRSLAASAAAPAGTAFK